MKKKTKRELTETLDALSRKLDRQELAVARTRMKIAKLNGEDVEECGREYREKYRMVFGEQALRDMIRNERIGGKT